MRVQVTKSFSFEAAHFLTDYQGDCGRVHGHTYILEVTISNPSLQDSMVLDFSDIKRIVQDKVIKLVDHQMLNDVLPFRTTAENIATWAFIEIRGALRQKQMPRMYCELEAIKLYETQTSFVEVFR